VVEIPERKTPDIFAILSAKGIDVAPKSNETDNLIAWINSIDKLGRMEIWFNQPVIPV
jgi:hypothetical protein